MLKILNPDTKPEAENLTRVTIGQRPAGVTPRLLQRYNEDVLTSKCVVTNPIRICPCVGCSSSCARAVTWQYCLRTPAPASSEATSSPVLHSRVFPQGLRPRLEGLIGMAKSRAFHKKAPAALLITGN